MEELHVEKGEYRPFTRQWLENILIQNGGKIFKYSEKVKIGVGNAFGSSVRIWVNNGREYMMLYSTDDLEFFLKKFDKIMEAVTCPHYFMVVKKTEMFYANGSISIPAPLIEYPFIEGVNTRDIYKN